MSLQEHDQPVNSVVAQAADVVDPKEPRASFNRWLWAIGLLILFLVVVLGMSLDHLINVVNTGPL
ncbi:hypothetical protein QP027_10390 [Corynebacterium breve]|uniref:Uncharacterized protein n=1 Tax=Corynebacterium breve TaxID=3049799 RepID=A0ABY8VCV1_9CORY|nr:hypothetical protein [Corynebacterium breve]WIM67496.1 hypothetical protein QP027_10390 [Corynebacterium breve]